eukprot:scaffold26591_cov127-Cylindrotheca_fusiformis.AAC.1
MTVDDFLQKTVPYIHQYDFLQGFRVVPAEGPGDVLPGYQQYPFRVDFGSQTMTTGYDMISLPRAADLFEITKSLLRPTIGFANFYVDSTTRATGSQVLQPIFDTVDTTAAVRKVVAIINVRLYWIGFFKNVLTQGQDGVVVVLRSACAVDYTRVYGENLTDYVDDPEDLIGEDIMTYEVDGPD